MATNRWHQLDGTTKAIKATLSNKRADRAALTLRHKKNDLQAVASKKQEKSSRWRHLKMRVFLAIVAVLVAVSAVQNAAAAAEAPAPSPTSDATAFAPAILASLVALAFGQLLF
ncbi:ARABINOGALACTAN PEPTIDE 13-LIKE [Salix purpurea]|uniref:ARABINOGALACTAN PEPTIDE 13-LIKE n=1 Tax=Salix purpurea TaxID=77065 RepID=A0A9Q1A9P4_SALPP|nr:ARABINOGALACTAN PEPTIDE 13-LIKE [Salix purpurea]